MKLKFKLLFVLYFTLLLGPNSLAACGPEAGQLPCCDSALSEQYGSKITDPNGPPVVTLGLVGAVNGVGGTSQFYNGDDTNPVAAVNCTAETDPSCASGYCGYANFNSPINLSNTFGEIIDNIGDFGATSRFLSDFKALEIVDPTSSTPAQLTYNSSGALTEGAVLAINNCTGDWLNCKPILYDANGNACANFKQVFAASDAAPNMAKPAVAADGSFLSDANGRQLYCPLLRANVPTGDIFYHIISTDQFSSINANSGPQLTPFGGFFDAPTILTGVTNGDLFCIQAAFQTWWFSTNILTVSCKYNIPPDPHPPLPTQAQNDQKTLTLDPSCTDPSKAKTLASYSVFGKFMQCINSTFTNMFTKPSITGVPNPILKFQMNLRNIVSIALTLYIIAFGIKITAGGMPKKPELFMFILKFALVFYFAVGTFSDATSASAVSQSQNGLVYYFNQLFKVMAEFSNNIMMSGNKADNGFCFFDPNWYDDDYRFLALWDSLDCHMSSYLGFTSLMDGSVNATNIISLIWTYLIGFNPLMTIFLTVFAFFTISVIVELVKIFVISMFGLTFLALLGPLFIPMALFTNTKSYFEHWLNLVFSFVLQPAIVSAGVALILVTLDSQIYDQCAFKTLSSSPTVAEVSCSSTSATGSCYAVFDTSDPNYSSCQNSFGYWAASPALFSVAKNESVLGLFTYVSPFPVSSSITAPLMTTVIMLFLFYQFVNMLGSLAGDLTNGMGLSEYGPSPRDTRVFLEKILSTVSSIKGKKAIANAFRKKPRKADRSTTATTTDGDKTDGDDDETKSNKARAKSIGEEAAAAGRARLERLAKEGAPAGAVATSAGKDETKSDGPRTKNIGQQAAEAGKARLERRAKEGALAGTVSAAGTEAAARIVPNSDASASVASTAVGATATGAPTAEIVSRATGEPVVYAAQDTGTPDSKGADADAKADAAYKERQASAADTASTTPATPSTTATSEAKSTPSTPATSTTNGSQQRPAVARSGASEMVQHGDEAKTRNMPQNGND